MAKLKKFDDLTPAGKRVRICKDALAQLDAKKLKVSPGTYISNANGITSLQTALKDPAAKCNVCALGAALCGLTVNNGDFNFSMNNWLDAYEIWGVQEKLLSYFSWQQMALIEGCFEGSFISNDQYVVAPFSEGRYDFRGDRPFQKYKSLYRSPEKRLRSILENIIANRGTFKMPKECFVWRGKPVFRNPKFDFKAVNPAPQV